MTDVNKKIKNGAIITKTKLKKRKITTKLADVILPTSKLRFNSDQLQNLNFIFNNKLARLDEENSNGLEDKSRVLAKSVSERLVQRLLCGAGIIDQRFTSKYLISLNQIEDFSRENSLDYIVRLDKLSIPNLYETSSPTIDGPNSKQKDDNDSDLLSQSQLQYTVTENDADYPAGYARIRVHSTLYRQWGEFCNNGGYLRRDKIQAKMVELLARAAVSETPGSPLSVDDAHLCGSPGKIVNPYTLHKLLKINSEEHVYYGANGNSPRFPDPRDFKLAIVDEPDGIHIRIEFLSPALSSVQVTVRLLVAIGLDAWPSSADFPARVSFTHSDSLLYHKSALTGMYLVGFGVQSSAWQIRLPAAEYLLLNNYSNNSTVRNILNMLSIIFEEIDRKSFNQYQAHHIVSNYLLKSAVFHELEQDSSPPTVTTINWSPIHLSKHVLHILDSFIFSVRKQRYPSYFFSKVNLLVNPGHLCEDDYILQSNRIFTCLLKLHDISQMSTHGNEEFEQMLVDQDVEMLLLYKWKELVDGLLPPSSTRGRRFCFIAAKFGSERVAHTQYTQKQLQYIGMLLKNVLAVKSMLNQNFDNFEHSTVRKLPTNHTEDVIYILASLVQEAKERYFKIHKINNLEKIVKQYNAAFAKLIDLVRKDKEIAGLNFEDDLVLVKTILKWLYKTLDYNKKHLGPMLRPYLNSLFVASHATSWHFDSINKSELQDEISALGVFAKLVNAREITPAEGLVDAVNKKWTWAKDILELVKEQNLRLIFIDSTGRVNKHLLSVPVDYKNKFVKSMTIERSRSVNDYDFSGSRRGCFTNLIKTAKSDKDTKEIPIHLKLARGSIMNVLVERYHRRGDHRCAGEILETLLTMQKMNILQELSTYLPSEERLLLLETIQQLCAEKKRSHQLQTLTLRKRSTLPQQNFGKCRIVPVTGGDCRVAHNMVAPRYTKKDDLMSGGFDTVDANAGGGGGVDNSYQSGSMIPLTVRKVDLNLSAGGSLIGSCRNARIREDSNIFILEETFKVRSLQRNLK